jgi:RNA polymerase sigma-70 factor (ECF subfamily)
MMEDRNLVRRTIAGERGAFDEIVRRYQDGLFRHLLRLTGRPEEAEDLCQETFIRFYGALRRFNPQRPIAPYLFTIATNMGRTRAARAGAQTQPFEQQSGEASVAEQALARLEYQQILAAVKQLRPEQQEAVSLYYDQGLSYQEIARITKVPVGTVSTRLRLARVTLRQALAAGLVIPAGVGELPQYLTSVLQGQATAPSNLLPAVTHGISTLAPAGAGLLTLLKGAVVMNKAIYVAIGLTVVGGAVVGVPRLISHNNAAKLPGRVERANTMTNLSSPSPKSVSRKDALPSRAPENPSPIAKTATTNLSSPSPESGSSQEGRPNWPPEHPSPEYLRAAKYLKAIPAEMEPYSERYLPSWELFGSLTDQQIQKFMTAKKVKIPLSSLAKDEDHGEKARMHVERGQAWIEGDNYCYTYQSVYVPIKELSPRQREIFAEFTAAYDQEHPGNELLNDLYSLGANQDLSNVELGFMLFCHYPIGVDVKPASTTPGLISSVNAGSFALKRE